MENATKALLMAGGVLIALLIIGALILMFNGLTSYQDENIESTRQAQVTDFNNQYIGYDRKDVRGSELLSLLNKAVDYNERKSSVGTNGGKELAYEAMTINYKFTGANQRKTLTYDGKNRLFTTVDSYTASGTTNEFAAIETTIGSLKNKYYGEDVIQKLASNITGIYNATTENAGLEKYNSIVNSLSKKNKYSDIKGTTIETDICTYYEYMQFKRVNFKCTGTTYNQKTGRIISMSFECTGTFN